MKPIWRPSRMTGRTVRIAWNVAPSFRMSVSSSSNFPFSIASRRSRGTRVGTFFGTWNHATLILPITSWAVQPNRASASAEYCCTVFFFQAEDGIRYLAVTGVQTCALPISLGRAVSQSQLRTACFTGRAERDRRPRASVVVVHEGLEHVHRVFLR